MKPFRFLVPAIVVALVLTIAIIAAPFVAAKQNQPKEYSLSVKKVENQWKVVSATGDTVKAKPGDRVTWTAVGTDAYFQFMDDKLFGGFTRMVKAGQKLTLPVGAGARKGINPYAVFCVAGSQFARGDSPPIIIIE
jgi:plastocyanin